MSHFSRYIILKLVKILKTLSYFKSFRLVLSSKKKQVLVYKIQAHKKHIKVITKTS